MKLYIKKKVRFVLIVVIPLFMCITLISWYLLATNSSIKGESESSEMYQNSIAVNYKVSLKPNPIYEDNTLGEGNVYISNFVDNIDTTFNYKFGDEKESNIEGECEIVGILEAYTGEKDNLKTIWKKQYIIMEREKFNIKSGATEINKKVAIKYDDYNNFKKNIYKDLKFSTKAKLTVSMNVYLKNNNDLNKTNKTTTASIIIPLSDDYFEITKSESKDNPEVLKETKKVVASTDNNNNIVFVSMLLLLLVALIYVLFFTVGEERALIVKRLEKIFKDYGKRLVALNSGKPEGIEICIKVNSMEDLVRIADELGKPIFYKYELDNENINEFYVIDNNQIYVYDVMGNMEDQQEDKVN